MRIKRNWKQRLFRVLIQACRVMVTALIGYGLIGATMTAVLPLIGGLLAQAAGSDVQASLLNIFGVWMTPMLFLCMIMALIEWSALKAFWRWTGRVVSRWSEKAEGEES